MYRSKPAVNLSRRNAALHDLSRSLASVGMAPITVKAATPDDLDALLESVAGLFREDSGHDSLMDPGWPARDGAAYYAGLMGDQACLLALARDGDRVIGHLVGKLSGPNSIRTGGLAILESMRVAPGARRAGVGGLLVRHFFDWAREGGAQQASVTAYAANHAARRFYARHGFIPQSVIARAVL
jgi:GNAT superfamily N-acetyltransferase